MIAMLQSWGPWQWIDATVIVSVAVFVGGSFVRVFITGGKS